MLAIRAYPGLFVASAGNENNNNDTNPAYPASYRENTTTGARLANIISVGAHDKTGARSVWTSSGASNWGATTVDVFAPGGKGTSQNSDNCITTSINSGYTYFNGTSAAAPHVTGVAALILSKNPHLAAAELKHIIMQTVEKVSGLNGYCVSGGRLDAYAAVSYTVPNPIQVNKTYRIKNVLTGYYLEVENSSLNNNTYVIQHIFDTHLLSQRFVLRQYADGNYGFEPVHALGQNKRLSLQYDLFQGWHLKLVALNNNANEQKFGLVCYLTNQYMITTAGNNHTLCLTVSDNKPTNNIYNAGQRIGEMSPTGNSRHYWTFTEVP